MDILSLWYLLYFFQIYAYSYISITYVVLILLFNVVFVSMLSGCWFLVTMISLSLFRVIFLKFCALKFLFLFSLDLFVMMVFVYGICPLTISILV